jgi:hypothetical protein
MQVWRLLTGTLLVLVVCLGVDGAKAQTTQLTLQGELRSLKASEALGLAELRDRWRELVDDDIAQVTPFSQTGIKVVTQGLEQVLGLPPGSRSEAISALKSGALVRLLPQDQLKKYCGQIEHLEKSVSANAGGEIKAELAAEIVHAAPVLAALTSELPTLIDKLGTATKPDSAMILAEVRRALVDRLDLRRARAATELLLAGSDAGLKLLRRSLGGDDALQALYVQLPPIEFGQLLLCRGPLQPLQVVSPKVRRDWAKIKAALDGFFSEADVILAALETAAYDQASTIGPFRELIEPDGQGLPEELAKGWRIVFAYAPASTAPDSQGTLELSAVNNVLRRTLPLGISIANVKRIESANGKPAFQFKGDAYIQSVSTDLASFRAALAEIGTPEWIQFKASHVRLTEDLQTIDLDLTVILPALGIELPSRLSLRDTKGFIELSGELERRLKEIASALKTQFVSSLPWLSTSWGETEVKVTGVELLQVVGSEPPRLGLTGTVNSPLGMLDVDFELAVDPAAPFRLRKAHVPEAFQVQIAGLINSSIDAGVRSLNTPVTADSRQYLRRCLVVEGVNVAQGGGTAASLFLNLRLANAERKLELAGKNSSDFSKVLNTLKDDLIKCLTTELATYQARKALGLSEQQIADHLARLQTLKIELLGSTFNVKNVRRPSGKRGFVFDLVALPNDGGGEIRLGGVELKLDVWSRDGTLSFAALDLGVAELKPTDIRRLVLAALGVPGSLIEGVDVAVSAGAVRVTVHLSIDALGGKVTLPALDVSLASTKVQFRDAFLGAANALLAKLIEERLPRIIPDLGPIKSATLVGAKSTFLPSEGKNAKIVFSVLTDLEYAKIIWKIELEIDKNGRSTIRVTGGDIKEQALALITGKVGELLQGIAPGVPENVTVLAKKPYGLMFDIGADVGGFKVTMRGVRVTAKGLKVDPRVKLEYRQPPGIPIPPAFQALPLDVTIDLENLANFELGALITVSGDSYGIIGLQARLRGKGAEKRLETEGVIKIAQTIPLVKSRGVADFRRAEVRLRTETVGEFSKLLNFGDQVTIIAKPLSAELEAGIKALGIGAEGHLRIVAEGDKAIGTLGGKANLLLGSADVDMKLDPRLRGSGARGSVDIKSIATASLTVTPATAQVALEFCKVRIKLIAPSVAQLTPALLDEALRRIFDFKLSLDSLKNREIVISLLDASGRTNTDPIGGDPIDREGPDDAPTEDKPSPVKEQGGGGDAQFAGGSLPGCGIAGSKMIVSPSKFPGHVVEMTEAPNIYYFYHRSRVAPANVWESIKGQRQIACFEFGDQDLRYPYFEPEGFRVASPFVQVLVRQDGKPTVMVWRKDQAPVELLIDDDLRQILLSGSPKEDLVEASKAGFQVRGYGRRLLRLVVKKAINTPNSERVTNVAKVTHTSLMTSLGLRPVSGAIAMMEGTSGKVLRVMAEGGNDDTPDFEIRPTDQLFASLEDVSARRGPLGQLAVAAQADNHRLQVLGSSSDCTIMAASPGRGAWKDRLFIATRTKLMAIALVDQRRTADAIGYAKAGQIVCENVLAGGDDGARQALSAGAITSNVFAIAFGRELGTSNWGVRLVQLESNPDEVSPKGVAARYDGGSNIEARLKEWSAQGDVRDSVLSKLPLAREGQLWLLDTLVLPETKYMDRLVSNPRGLL